MKMNTITLLALALGASTCLLTAQDNPPPSAGNPQSSQHQAGPGGRGGFHLLPPRAEERLKLTDDQKQQVAALEAETKAKLEKILTPEQLTQLKKMRPPMPPAGGRMRGNPGGDDSTPPSGPPPGGDDNNLPSGPPPGDGNGNSAPSGPPPGEN